MNPKKKKKKKKSWLISKRKKKRKKEKVDATQTVDCIIMRSEARVMGMEVIKNIHTTILFWRGKKKKKADELNSFFFFSVDYWKKEV